jgi:predicted short-subunit dehydrogenase-like oxidoreductase (DUF2520 family)
MGAKVVATPDEAPEQLAILGRIGIVGTGALGASLAYALAARGARLVAVTARHAEHAADLASHIPGCQAVADASPMAALCDFVVLAVPDDALSALDITVPWRAGQMVVHMSGARSAAVLAHAAEHGAAVAALHPLMIFPRAATGPAVALARLAGCTWAMETADDELAARLEALVRALDGQVLRLASADHVPYHLAAVLASNYVVTLLGTAVGIWEAFGIEPDRAVRALLPLLRATVENLATLGPAAALAGPVARGDVGTVSAHLAWLRARVAEEHKGAAIDAAAVLAAYRALAELTVPLARARGSLAAETEQALYAALREPH